MGERAEVVVIGGGVQGLAMAAHLLDAGVASVRVLERDGLFEATSSAGAGYVAIWAAMTPRPYGPEEAAVERYGLDFYRDLQERGHSIGFVENGLLYVAVTDSAFDHFRGIRRPELDPGTVLVDPAEVGELSQGTVDVAGVVGGLFQPAAAQVNTSWVGAALAGRVRDGGGVIDERRPALGVRVRSGRIESVATPSGDVHCEKVVLAAGAWANEFLGPLGVRLPFVPHVASRIISEPLSLPAAMPAMMLFGVEPGGPVLWIRQHEGRLLWGGTYRGHPHDALVGAEQLPARFDEVALDGVVECQRVAASAAAFMPAMGRYASMTVKHGAPAYTPDYRALVGPVPGVDGLYVMAGDNEAGVTHGPGFAKVLADHIVDGKSDLAGLAPWAVDRFGDRFPTDADVAAAVAGRVAAF